MVHLYEKGQVIDYMWQYSKFYGNKLGECERYFEDGEGYVAVILLFEVTENICKSIIGEYEASFFNIVKKLKEYGRINEEEEGFLSIKEFSVRKIRNLFAHANLMGINIVQDENGRDIYYPLTEEDSCLLLYKKISYLLFNVLLKVVKDNFIIGLDIDFGDLLTTFTLNIKELSARETLKLMGHSDRDIEKMESVCDKNMLQRMADNSSNLIVLKMILSNLAE
jgi:hypothetical protein